MTTVSFDSHGVRCEGTWFAANDPADATGAGERRPCVVMAHGFGATRDTGLAPFADRFAAAGLHALTFDYRGFGTSHGSPRQDVHHRRHREDYHAALTYVRSRPDVDPDRVAVWGSSYSGGHVIAVAAADQRIAAVVSQGAAMDGVAALLAMRRTAGTRTSGSLTGSGLRDLGRALIRREPLSLPITGPEGSGAVISAPGAEEGYLRIAGPTFVNSMLARGVLRIPFNRPVSRASKVSCPALIVVAERDNVAPVGAVRRVAAILGDRAEVLSFDCGHFDVYVGDVFTRSVAAQVDFLCRALLRLGRPGSGSSR